MFLATIVEFKLSFCKWRCVVFLDIVTFQTSLCSGGCSAMYTTYTSGIAKHRARMQMNKHTHDISKSEPDPDHTVSLKDLLPLITCGCEISYVLPLSNCVSDEISKNKNMIIKCCILIIMLTIISEWNVVSICVTCNLSIKDNVINTRLYRKFGSWRCRADSNYH